MAVPLWLTPAGGHLVLHVALTAALPRRDRLRHAHALLHAALAGRVALLRERMHPRLDAADRLRHLEFVLVWLR